jgi:hypothetical protein
MRITVIKTFNNILTGRTIVLLLEISQCSDDETIVDVVEYCRNFSNNQSYSCALRARQSCLVKPRAGTKEPPAEGRKA